MSVPVRVAILFASFWVSGFALGHFLFPVNTAPQPTPRETPWLWVDTAPEGGACYVFADTLGPCFTKPSPEATP